MTEQKGDGGLFLKRPPSPFPIRGVIANDNVLIDHYGKAIEDAGYFWDHVEERYKIAHDYLFANYVCTTGKHYPQDTVYVEIGVFVHPLGSPIQSGIPICWPP
jgi:hypothetical protein